MPTEVILWKNATIWGIFKHCVKGVLADPDDCRAFYSCDSYHAEHYICGETLLFDEKFLVCNFDYVVDCGDRPIPGVSTTSTLSPITTTSSGRKQQFVSQPSLSLGNSVPCVTNNISFRFLHHIIVYENMTKMSHLIN